MGNCCSCCSSASSAASSSRLGSPHTSTQHLCRDIVQHNVIDALCEHIGAMRAPVAGPDGSGPVPEHDISVQYALTDAGLERVVDALEKSAACGWVASIAISGYKLSDDTLAISDTGATHLLGWVRTKNPHLRLLDLSYNRLTSVTGVTLAPMLRASLSHTLTALTLSGNPLGDETAMALGKSLRKNRTLASLDIRACGMTNDGLMDIGMALRGNTSLTSLNISENSLNTEGALEYERQLRDHNTTLLRLSFSSEWPANRSVETHGEPVSLQLATDIRILIQRNVEAAQAAKLADAAASDAAAADTAGGSGSSAGVDNSLANKQRSRRLRMSVGGTVTSEELMRRMSTTGDSLCAEDARKTADAMAAYRQTQAAAATTTAANAGEEEAKKVNAAASTEQVELSV